MNFKIKYSVELRSGNQKGTIIVKNQLGELNAKVNLEIYLKKKHIDFKKLIVYSCYEDNDFMNLFNMFK